MPRPASRLIPVMGPDLLALAYSGQEVREVAVFNGANGKWSIQVLDKPTKGQISPIVGPGSVLYQFDRDFYAFSGVAWRWGVLRLGEGEEPKFQFGSHAILVQQGDTLWVFSLKRGRWTEGVAMDLSKDAK